MAPWLITQAKQKTNSVAFRPQANYTDWATSTCQRNLVPTFVDREVSRGQRGGSPTIVNLSLLDTSSINYNCFQISSRLLFRFYPSENSVSVEGEMFTPREMRARVPQGFVPFLTLHILYINNTLITWGIYLSAFADATCTHVMDRREGYVLRKLQRGLN
jgi:hypothetical protein